jgi:hypothetical protein
MPSSTAARVACNASSTRAFCHAADELREPLLELLAIVVGGRVLDLVADLVDAAVDVLLGARAVDDDGVVLVDHHPLGLAEVLEGHVLELEAELFGPSSSAMT